MDNLNCQWLRNQPEFSHFINKTENVFVFFCFFISLGKPDDFISATHKYGTTSIATTTLEKTTEPTTVHTTPSSEATTTTKEPTTPSYTFTNVTSAATTLLTTTTNQRKLTTRKSILPFPELCYGILNAINFGADGNLYVFIGKLDSILTVSKLLSMLLLCLVCCSC